MARYEVQKIVCENCGRQHKVKIYDVVDVRRDPKLKKKVIKDELQLSRCPFCGEFTRLDYDLTYIDPSNMITITLANTKDMYHEALETLDPRLLDEDDPEDVLLKAYLENSVRRIVRNSTQLAEKALIFDKGLDDRVIEIIKVIYAKLKENDGIEDMVFNIGEFSDGSTEMCFLPLKDGVMQNDPYPLKESTYLLTENEYMDLFTSFPNTNLEVDRDWAEAFLDYAGEMQAEEHEVDEDAKFVNEVMNKYYAVMDDEPEAAKVIKENWEEVMNRVLKKWDTEKDGRPTLEDLENDDYETYLGNWLGDIDMTLGNAKEHAFRMDFSENLLNVLDLSDDPLMYYNTRRSYMESLGEVQGFDKMMNYLYDWKKEDSDSAYLAATEIFEYEMNQQPEKAYELAKEYMYMPLKKSCDDWLFDSCENIFSEYNDQKRLKEIKKRRKEKIRFYE
ncbi:MAG: CpXC domain-containing protein [Solobacterium sp.]|nr:CpXC domain-containing protein [Solobacterium sp.]